MEGRLAYIGPNDPVTMPNESDVPLYENGRRYQMAPPGWVYRYGPRDGAPMKAQDPQADYGLLILDDFIITEKRLTIGENMPDSWDERNGLGHERARDLEVHWKDYGVILIQGGFPSPEEIAEARQRRIAWAERIVDQDEHRYALGVAGRSGHRPEHSTVAKHLASEIGKVLSHTGAALPASAPVPQAPPPELADGRVECPECFGLIDPRSRKCQHCQSRWQKPVSEIIAAAAAVEA